jgi:hypothetical protein
MKDPRSGLPLIFLWAYRGAIENQSVTTIYLPGHRMHIEDGGYSVGETIPVRAVERFCIMNGKIVPIFSETVAQAIFTERIEIRKIGSLAAADFSGSTLDIFDQASLVQHLGLIHNLRNADLCVQAIVTKITFSYVYVPVQNPFV